MTMADPATPTRHADDDTLAAEVRRVRDEYADEEAQAAEREAAENAAALDVGLSLRISRELDDALKSAESPQAFVQILRDAEAKYL